MRRLKLPLPETNKTREQFLASESRWHNPGLVFDRVVHFCAQLDADFTWLIRIAGFADSCFYWSLVEVVVPNPLTHTVEF